MTDLVALPTILPLLGAGLCLVMGRSARAQRLISIVTLLAIVGIASVLVFAAHDRGPQVLHLAGWPETIGISLVADRLSAILLLISAIVLLCVLLYSFGQGIVVFGRDTPLSVFYPTYLVLAAGVNNAFLAGDLFNLFVGFEVLLAASYVLITFGGTGPRVRAGTTYIVVSLMSSMIFLAGVAVIYGATGTMNLAQISERVGELSDGTQLMLQVMLLTAFAIKAAVFPLSAWLPDSYPTAPASVTAVFAGLLTKVGVYAIIRTQTLLFPDNPLGDMLLWAALFTMIVGILGAVAQSDIKRMLSFTLVSHIGYMIFGIALGTQLGVSGAIFYVVHHITIQTTLFLVAGLIEHRTGTTSLDKLGGLARAAPILSVLFFIPAMNLAGIPPLSGFLGKLALVRGGIDVGGWLEYTVAVAAIVTGLLTLYAIAKAWSRAFWQPNTADDANPDSDTLGALYSSRAATSDSALGLMPEEAEATATESRLPLGMTVPTVLMVLVSLALTVAAGPIFAYTDAAAADLLDASVYIDAVLGGMSR